MTLTPDDEIRVQLARKGRVVVKFALQYLAHIGGEWRPVVRFDTAHGRAHQDISHPNGTRQTRELEIGDYGIALAHALQDVKARWEFYRERYERWQGEA